MNAPVAKQNLGMFRSPAARKILGTRKQKRVPNTKAPNVNLSYVKNRNESFRNVFNEMVVSSNVSHNKPLTNKQKEVRITVARKMARGEPVTMQEKFNAGMVTFPKPSMPKPPPPKMMTIPKFAVQTKGGKRTRRYTVRRR